MINKKQPGQNVQVKAKDKTKATTGLGVGTQWHHEQQGHPLAPEVENSFWIFTIICFDSDADKMECFWPRF